MAGQGDTHDRRDPLDAAGGRLAVDVGEQLSTARHEIFAAFRRLQDQAADWDRTSAEIRDGAGDQLRRPLRAGTLRVVVVDDSASARALVGEYLRDAGHEMVGEAADGSDAVAVVGQTACDVVVMDHNMPVLDGPAATRQIVAMPRAPRVVGFSSDTMPDRRAEMLAAGAEAWYAKDDREGLMDYLRRLAGAT